MVKSEQEAFWATNQMFNYHPDHRPDMKEVALYWLTECPMNRVADEARREICELLSRRAK